MKQYIIAFIILANIALTACISHRESIIEGTKYDETTNKTNYIVFPYGSVSIPGKWEKTRYDKVSRQQFFTNKDSIHIAIAFTPYSKYEFNIDVQKKATIL